MQKGLCLEDDNTLANYWWVNLAGGLQEISTVKEMNSSLRIEKKKTGKSKSLVAQRLKFRFVFSILN